MSALVQVGLPLTRGERLARQEIVVSYGGGVNSVASLIWLARNGFVPRAIVMADPGSERKRTIWFRDEVLPPWLATKGFPKVTVITRAEEGKDVARAWRLESLRDECFRIGSLPSVAYGWKKCSQKYKGDTARWWLARQWWAHREWLMGRKVAKVFGYDLDEPGRIRASFGSEWEDSRVEPWYPLFDAKIDRDGCEALIASEGLPSPGKSACTFCPNNTLAEWQKLREEEPDAFADAVAMSRQAEPSITSESVGLMRCHPAGKRHLHLWADGAYEPQREIENDDPCECAS